MKILAGTLIDASNTARTLRKGVTVGPCRDLRELRDRIAGLPFVPHGDLADFGRGGPAARLLMLAALLTAGDSGKTLPENTAVFGWNGRGCTAENLRFWQDYTANGRESGRGGLFVATLPTIPFCEAAIALGCRGPAAYFRTGEDTAELFPLIAGYPPGDCLAGECGIDTACMFLIRNDGNSAGMPSRATLSDLFNELRERGI